MTPYPPSPALWDAYRRAVLELPDLGLAWPVDGPMPAPALAALQALSRGLADGVVCVITADNPGGGVALDDANTRSRQQLRDRLAGLGTPTIRCDGLSPDGTHREIGWACGLPEALGVLLAQEFGQLAIYVWRAPDWWLVPVAESPPPVRLGGVRGEG